MSLHLSAAGGGSWNSARIVRRCLAFKRSPSPAAVFRYRNMAPDRGEQAWPS
jgi:hypothetical protein